MRHFLCWPGQLAYAGHKSRNSPFAYHTRGHRHGGANFGVRRPLRYLSHHLDLDESQTRRMASVLNQLKTEREQAELDEKRTVTALAGLMDKAKERPTLDEVRGVLAPRLRSAEKLSEETAKAVVTICDFLDDDQRDQFVNLLLSGALSL